MNRYEFYSNLQTYQKNSLEHHGIIGQKWGKRRWQNSDGTFNEAGKERYFGKKEIKNKEENDDNSSNKKIGGFTFAPRPKYDKDDIESWENEYKDLDGDLFPDYSRKDYINYEIDRLDDEYAEKEKEWKQTRDPNTYREMEDIYAEMKRLNRLGSISKPKIKAKYLNEDGTLNEEGKARVHAKANASATASAVFKIFKWLKIVGMPISAISGISLAAMGAPATMVVAALAGLGIQGLSATGDHIIAKKLENRSTNYYKMLNGGNTNE